MKHDVESFRRAAAEAAEWIAGYLADPGRYRVNPDIRPGELMDRLPACGPEHGETLAQIQADFERLILPAVTHWNHPRFFNYFACTASVPGVIAEMLAASLNTNGFNWIASPAAAELEQVAVNWVRQWMGLAGDYFGQIFDTASISTLHAVMAARERADPEARLDGITKRLTVYSSEQAHSSIDKAVIAAGIGLRQLRKIGTDAEFRMRPELLERAMAADAAAGFTPCCVIATVGSTSTASVDPLEPILDIAERYNAWVHVDAAYGGAAALLPEFAWMLRGNERAHSLVVNPHKWMFTPMDCSVFFTRHPDILRRTFTVTPEYLKTTADPREVNLMDYGVALGRRFRGLKLWYVLRYYGLDQLRELIRGHIAMAREFASWVESDDRFALAAPVSLSVVCFQLRKGEAATRGLVAAVNQTGEFFISQTLLQTGYAARVAIGNQATTTDDVRALWTEIVRQSERL
ncbi:MAG TPA: pyridoxal-dependent decarboxylase [Bryobacteraceae bacterium]|nr:pyridoxal-dependent decarboxylase [Bryobacteraceae bacterium]